jgi:hypothetical protein
LADIGSQQTAPNLMIAEPECSKSFEQLRSKDPSKKEKWPKMGDFAVFQRRNIRKHP